MGGISDPVLTAGPGILWKQDQGTQGWGKYVEGRGKSHDKSAGCGGTQIVIVPICYQCMPALPALLVQLQATHRALSLCFVTYKMGRGTVPGGNGYTCLVALGNRGQQF